jgi:threonine/homoserine/homoserine lactone efflux protein
MVFISLLEGIAIGFVFAMPVGPIGILCIQRTLTEGHPQGFVIGLSGASADILYALVAAFGITLISNFVTGFQHWFQLAGGVLLLILGFSIFRSQPSVRTASKKFNGHTKTFFSTFLLALTNPMTLFAFATVFSAVKSRQLGNDQTLLPIIVAGVFLGSLSWFSLLISLTGFFKKNIASGGMTIVHRIAGCLLMSFGVVAVWIGMNSF